MDRRRFWGGAAVLALLLVLSGTPAAAGGGFNSSMTDWLPGLSSRSWKDSVHDSNRTYIALAGCRLKTDASQRVTLRIQLTKETPFYKPDKDLGRHDFACHQRKVQHSWSPQVGGSYHFTLTHVDGSTHARDKVSASSVGVVY
ncbi:MAG: hypothetical protein JWO77_2840 [Ilumatobacteraceae bacterium]|nr:hypothetical protein [Ilumatobacteraceae bacterium]